MEAQEISIRLGQLFWQTNWPACERNKILLQRGLWEETPQSLAQDNVQLFVQRDESGVERGIVKRREAKAVSRIEPVVRKFSPRLDVARDQQARHVDAADATANVISGEN